jgi:pectate lyase
MNAPGAPFVEAVRRFADAVLDLGRDAYGGRRTPLFVDGLSLDGREPVRWRSQGEDWVLSNLASQQVLLRVLDGLSALAGEARYREAALDAVRFALAELRVGDLLCWGGHMAFDLERKKPVLAVGKGDPGEEELAPRPLHELKSHYPYWELFWEADPAETRRFIEGYWEAHVLDWETLEFSRHGAPGKRPAKEVEGGVWGRSSVGGPVFFRGRGLTFMNAGSDLYYAAGMLHSLGGDEGPLVWAKRLARRYVETRHPATGLGGYQFSISITSFRGDRAVEQLGGQLARHDPIEARVCMPGRILTIIGHAALCRMRLFEVLGPAGRELLDWAVEDLLAFGRHSYDPATNQLHPLLTDGTRLTGLVLEKDGYYGKKGAVLGPLAADSLLLWSYAKAFRLSRAAGLWNVARGVALGCGFGDIGAVGGSDARLEAGTRSADPRAIFAFLELFDATANESYLALARAIGENILEGCIFGGLFAESATHRFTRLDRLEPLALLHLASALRGEPGSVPAYCGGAGYFEAEHDGAGLRQDGRFIYAQRLAAPGPS